MIDIAIAYLKSGLCVLPALLAEKRPALNEWKKYQERLPTETEVHNWFAGDDPDAACCLLTGKVSGNLELLDFDLQGELFDAWSKRVAERSPGLLERLVIESSQSGGFHAIYRCESAISGNIKLAQRKLMVATGDEISLANKKYKPRQDAEGKWFVLLSLIETRGEGGIFLCYPSSGYELLQGQIDRPPVLSAAEREILLEAAWSLNEFFTEVAAPSNSSLSADDRPGDHFNERGDIRDLLKKHGWTLVKEGENEYWARPGKIEGWSATLKDRVLFVFSTNAAPFESQRAYSPFTAYALLEHGGDFSAAASALRAHGYGAPTPSYANDFRQFSGSPPSSPFQMPEISLQARSVRELVCTFPDLRDPIIHGLLREGEIMNLIASTKVGKALAIDTPILTESGWQTMETLQPGMKVHSADGSLTEIVAVSEIMFDRPCYRVTSRSGATVIADENHSWKVVQGKRIAIVPTKELSRGMNGRRWMLPISGALDRHQLPLPLDPWLLGYWIGNGTAREGSITVNLEDLDEVLRQINQAGFQFGKISYKGGGATLTVLGMKVILRDLGLLQCKRIPEPYLVASQQQRAALLAGLSDADGHASTHNNGSGSVEFTTTDQYLFFQVLGLIRSLGYKASTSVGRASLFGKDCGNKLRIWFAASRASSPFRLSRRISALPLRKTSQRSHRDAIKSVASVPSVPVKCIQVAHPSGLFLAGPDFMVTHNSWLATDLAIAVSTGRTWLEQFECERGDVLIIDNELHPETSAHRIPKVAAARQIPFDAFADHLFVENIRGRINDLLSMEQYFKKIPVGRYKLIILDAFYRFMPRNMDENDNGTMTTIYNRLDDYAEKLKTCFVLIHHTSKGNQSAKSITDVGAGAGSQSRATDTHLVLRLHDQPDVAVLDAAVRSWPPLAPRCLRWAYPVWMPAADLDPNQLRQEGKQRRTPSLPEESTDSKEREIDTTEQFVEEFVDAQPQLQELILEDAEFAGLSNARARQFLKRALARGLIYRWEMGGNQYGYATQPQYLEPDEGDQDMVTEEHSKRDIVAQMLLQFPDMTSKEIAAECGVSKRYVNRVRREIQGGN